MVQRCCVPNCTSKVGDMDIYGIKVRFHRMPHTAERFLTWCKLITDNRRFATVINTNSRVCSKHFRKEDYLMKKPFGHNPLRTSAEPCIFKWNSACFEDDQHTDVTTFQNTEDFVVMEGDKVREQASNKIYEMTFDCDLKIHRETQCNILCEKVIQDEISRKNNVIEQLLHKITALEHEQKAMETNISELRAASEYYLKQIDETRSANRNLEEKLKQKTLTGIDVRNGNSQNQVAKRNLEIDSISSIQAKKTILDYHLA